MGDYKLKIADQEYDSEVKGSEEWGETVSRDFSDKLLRVKGDYKFTGFQGLNDAIYNNLVSKGVCISQEGRIYYRGSPSDAYSEVWRGEIKGQDGQFDLLNLSVDSQVLDNCWSAKFNNANDQKVFIRSVTSKGGVSITECPRQDVTFYDVTDGSAYADTRTMFRVFDVLTFLVAYYTDNTVTFASEYFDVGGPGHVLHITTGKELRTYDGGVNPELSFTDVFDELNKKFDLWIVVDESDLDAPVLRIESREYSLDETVAITVDNPEGIVMQTDLDLLYTIVKVGSNQTDNGTDADYQNRRYLAWNDEEYATAGDCEFENRTLDLVSTWKIDTNSIQQALSVSPVYETHDDNIFMVEVDANGNAFKYTDDITDANPNLDFFYNFNLTNEQVLLNWGDAIPSDIIKDISKNINVYVDTVNLILLNSKKEDVIFTNDTVAPASDVDDIYTTPTEDVTYQAQFKPLVGNIYTITAQVWLKNYDTNNVFFLMAVVYSDDTRPSPPLAEYTMGDIFLNQSPIVPFTGMVEGTANIFIPENGVAVVRIYKPTGTTPIYDITAGNAQLTAAPITYQGGATEPLIYAYDVEQFKLSSTDYATLKGSLSKMVRFTDTLTGRYWDVWPKEMQWNRDKQLVTSGAFIGKIPTNPLCYVLDGAFGVGLWDDLCYWNDSESWVDCSGQYIPNPTFTNNPVLDWALTLATQTGVRTFIDSVGGAPDEVVLDTTITLPAGSYTLFWNFELSAAATFQASVDIQNSSLSTTTIFNDTNLTQAGSIAFTCTGGSSRTVLLQLEGSGNGMTFTTNLFNIC